VLATLGKGTSNALNAATFCGDRSLLSLLFGEISLHFPLWQGETGWPPTASTATL
jgi:hypothetical protein